MRKLVKVIALYKEKLKQIRLDTEISQDMIAKFIGINRSAYAHYENESDIMPLKHLNSVCNYFDVSLDYIFKFTNTHQYKNSIQEIDGIKAGKRLKEFRKEFKLTQVKLASILNTVHPVIVNYEKGKHLIATPFLYTICKTYNISADYLLGKIDYLPKF